MFITRVINDKEVMIELTDDELYKAYQYQQYLLDVQYVMSRVKFDQLHLVLDIATKMRKLMNKFDYNEEEEAFQEVISKMDEVIVK